MFQPSLFDVAREPSFDERYAQLERLQLDETAWVDFQAGWVHGADALFELFRATRPWKQRQRRIFNEWRTEPRLTAPWLEASGAPLHPVVDAMRRSLCARYGVPFDSVGFNLYRDGEDAVAWHRDAIDRAIVDPIVVLVSLGEPRTLSVRPLGGGPGRGFELGRGDLLVTGGSFQRTWEHAVLRVKHAGPRISLAFRHGLDLSAYDRGR